MEVLVDSIFVLTLTLLAQVGDLRYGTLLLPKTVVSSHGTIPLPCCKWTAQMVAALPDFLDGTRELKWLRYSLTPSLKPVHTKIQGAIILHS